MMMPMSLIRYLSNSVRALYIDVATTFFGLGFGLGCFLNSTPATRTETETQGDPVDDGRGTEAIHRIFDRYENNEVVVARGELLRAVMMGFMNGEYTRKSFLSICEKA